MELDDGKNSTQSNQPQDTMPLPSSPPISPPSMDTPASTPQAPAFPQKWLWIDPLDADDRIKSGAVLLDDVIHDYVFKYNVLFDNSTFDKGKLKGGSYTMTPAANDAWTFVPNEKPGKPDVKVALEKSRDQLGEYYLVPKNTLVYIKLEQKLRLPFYIIGRHNLKIRYVYKGLLLGTGPQVDPGFEGNLFIPLHNFTTSDVKIHLQLSFVSIDFVRTTRFINKTAITARTIEELRQQLEGTRKLIEAPKVNQRHTLEDYLDGSTPRSQMAQFEFDFNRLAFEVKKTLRIIKGLSIVERLVTYFAIAGLCYASLNYFRGFVADLKAETKELKAMAVSTNITQLENRLKTLELQLMQNQKGSTNAGSTNAVGRIR